MMTPMVATVAAAEPEMVPKNIQARMVTMARPPRLWPTMESAKSISRRLRPPPSISAPARINSGIAISVKESQPVNMVWAK